MQRKAWAWAVAGAVFAGCSSPGESSIDASAIDAAMVDSSSADAEVTDAADIDAPVDANVDAVLTDATAVDAGGVDSLALDSGFDGSTTSSLPTVTPVGGTALMPMLVTASCGTWDGQLDPRPALRVAVFSGSLASPQLPYWSLKVALGEVALGVNVPLPSTGAMVFVAETDPPGGNGNEASSGQSGSSGVIQLRESSCVVGGWVSVDIDALLASEVGLAAISVTGTFRDTITSPPP